MYQWNWLIKTKQGKERTGYTESPWIATPQQLHDHLKAHFHAVVFTDFKCEQGPCKKIMRPIPFDWYEYGTTRMKEEIDAGLRPFSETLLPPIHIPEPCQPLVSRVGKIQPLRRR
jgi:hypothetical protein